MPSCAIHLAIAEEYLRKNEKNSENYSEFIKGVVYPDTVEDKSKTHYGEYSSQSNLQSFLKENDTLNSFKKGHFLHLLTDYVFYNKCIDCWSEDIYNDYDILNDSLIEKYKLVIPEEGKQFIHSQQNLDLKILNSTLVDNFISEISEMNLDGVIQDVKNNPEEWTRVRPLKRL